MNNASKYQGHALLVEDDPFMRQSVADTLRDLAFETHTAATYQDGLAHVAAISPLRLLIADIAIPDRSDTDSAERLPLGLDIARFVKQSQPACGVVIWSAYLHFLPNVLEIISAGHRGIAYLPKGSRRQALIQAIGSVLAGDVYLHRNAISQRPQGLEVHFLAALPPDVSQVVKFVAGRLDELGPRQLEMVDTYTSTPAAIAQSLGLEVKTVHNYQDAIYERLGLKDPLTGAQAMRRDALIVLAVLLDRLRKGDASQR